MMLLSRRLDSLLVPLAVLLLLSVSSLAVAHVDEDLSPQINCPLCKILNIMATVLAVNLAVLLLLQIISNHVFIIPVSLKKIELHFHLVNRGPPAFDFL